MARRGKYAHIIDKLPRFLGTEPKYQEKVEAVKQAIVKEAKDAGSAVHAIGLSQDYERLRAEIDALEQQLSDSNLQLEAVSQLLVDHFEIEGVQSLRLEDGKSVGVQYEPYAQVKDREAFRLWCISMGLEKSMMLPWQTTNALTKERLLAGESEPDGVTAHAKTKIVLRTT